jgi:hypothetical protein
VKKKGGAMDDHLTKAGLIAEIEAAWTTMNDRLESLSEVQLTQADSESGKAEPVIGWIIGNTFEHYAEHQDWIEKMIE